MRSGCLECRTTDAPLRKHAVRVSIDTTSHPPCSLLDKRQMTSCFIHLFPSWLALTLRWYPLDPMRGGVPGAEPECQDGMDKEDVGTAMGLYLLWQVLYYLKTEVADKVRFDRSM